MINVSNFIDKKTAQQIDHDMMNEPINFSIDQLMEVAGLSVSESVRQSGLSCNRILVVCGPGNNGGDGLVASRYLVRSGISSNVIVLYPKINLKHPLFPKLINQLHQENIAIVHDLDSLRKLLMSETESFEKMIYQSFDMIVDAIFGFSFEQPVRGPFKDIIEILNESKIPIVSVDIPSGWDADKGINNTDIYIKKPTVIVSLMAPKLCIWNHYHPSTLLNQDSEAECVHFLGLPFVCRALAAKYGIEGLPYHSIEGCVTRFRIV